jgi:hypothetical protein
MIVLPPGCSVVFDVYIDVKKLTDKMIDWHRVVGGQVEERSMGYYRRNNNNETKLTYVRYGKAKWCHYNGGSVRLRFMGSDASLATMFLLKFSDDVVSHNMQEAMDRYEREQLTK